MLKDFLLFLTGLTIAGCIALAYTMLVGRREKSKEELRRHRH